MEGPTGTAGEDGATGGVWDPILDMPPEEDAGALTHSWFGFQWNCGVLFSLRTLRERPEVLAVVCETHEDFVLLKVGRPELVSVKHREPSTGPWSRADLLAGPLKHLAGRWVETGGRAACRLMTNQGLRSGTEQAQQLAHVCSDGASQVRRELAGSIATNIGLSVDDAFAFISELRIDAGLPGRNHIGDFVRLRAVDPVLTQLGLPLEASQPVYDRLLAEVARRSAERGFDSSVLVEALVEEDGHKAAVVLKRRVEARVLDARVVAACFRGLSPRGARLATDDVSEPTRLVQKLELGDLGPTAIASAKRLRAAWFQYEARWRGLPGGGDQFSDLRIRAQAMAARHESAVSHGNPYGRAMHAAIANDLAAGTLSAGLEGPADPELLLGLIFELTDQCEVWWSSSRTFT